MTPSSASRPAPTSAASCYLGIDTQDVGLSPFHEFEDQVSDETKAALAEAEAGLADGSLKACEEQAGTGFCVQTLP